MKYGVIHYNAPGATVEEFLDFAADAGFDSVELQIGDVWAEGDERPEGRAEAVRAEVQKRGLVVSALAAGNDFVVLEPDVVAAQVARMKRVCELARVLGTDVIRTEGGSPKDSVPEARWVEAMAGCLKRCREFAEAMQMKLAVDNHGWVTNNGDLQVELFQQVGSKCVGANLDTMNYRWFGHDLATIDHYYEIIAPYTFHTHLKDGSGSREHYQGAALGEGEIHLAHAVTCLRKAGYGGVWCAEFEGPGDTGDGYRRCLAWMKEHVR